MITTRPFSVLLVLVAALLGACAPRRAHRAPPVHATVSRHVYHLHDGGYAYHDDSSQMWFYYAIWSSHSSSPVYYHNLDSSAPTPSGARGGWNRVDAREVSEIEEETKGEAPVTVAVPVEPDGAPESAEASHEEQMEFDFDAPETSAGETEGGESSPSAASPSAEGGAGESVSSSGGGESGGGDSGGGGGGGGDGGGGGGE